jgi:hypothetical protein
VDGNGPLFFVSYSHSPAAGGTWSYGGDQNVRDFFELLSYFVSQLVPRRVGAEDPGFMDGLLNPGGEWSNELLQAIGTCQVFVALLNLPYTTSEWCGMEWYAFAQREVRLRSGEPTANRTAFMPVIWAPWQRSDELPKVIRDVHRFSPDNLPQPDVVGHYRHDGLLGLHQTGRHDAYRAVVWRLAQKIAAFQDAHVVEPRVLKREDLRNAFQEAP